MVSCTEKQTSAETLEESRETEIPLAKSQVEIEMPAGIEDNGVLDIFVYSASATKGLEFHARTSRPDTLELLLPPGDKIAAAIANCPFQFNLKALEMYDSIEQARFGLQADNPERPLMSGTQEFEAGTVCRVRLTPLICSVTLKEVENTMTRYRRLEDPVVYLENVNEETEILRMTGFRASETQKDTTRIPLPYDVGLYPQTPGITLYCYPNDSTEPTVGNPATTLVLECTIEGQPQRFAVTLPAIERASTHLVSISVSGPGSFTSEII